MLSDKRVLSEQQAMYRLLSSLWRIADNCKLTKDIVIQWREIGAVCTMPHHLETQFLKGLDSVSSSMWVYNKITPSDNRPFWTNCRLQLVGQHLIVTCTIYC